MQNKREYFLRLIEEWRQSGISQNEFCVQKGVKVGTYQYWNAKLNRERSQECHALVEVPAVVMHEPEPSTSGELQLVVRGYRIAVPRGFDGLALQQLIGFLERRDARA